MSDKNDVVIINLDRPRVLWYGHSALKKLCAMTGKKLSEFDSLMEDFDFDNLEKIFFCGLEKDAAIKGETLQLEDVESLLNYGEFHINMAKFYEAWGHTFGIKKPEESGEETKN